jgi:hypothetical protein
LHANIDIRKGRAMAASFDALGNHCINAAPIQHARFGDRRRARLYEDAGGFDRIDDLLIR